MSKDYRNTKYCPKLDQLKNKKKSLQEKIIKEHPNTTVFYNQVKKIDSEYNKEFRKIYNNKCAYCGVSCSFLPKRMFETDHFIPESSIINNKESGQLKNLVFSCYDCNRGKSNLTFEKKYQELLDPDNTSIANVFYRNDKYEIKINDKYCEDETINKFYNKLKFDYEIKRLDFLILNINGLLSNINEKSFELELNKLLNFLVKKRNVY